MVPEIKKILYATDFSHNSTYAFSYAIDMSQKRDAQIIILHAIEPIPPQIMFRLEMYDNQGVLRKARSNGKNEDIELIKNRVKDFCKKREAKSACRALNGYPKSSFPLVIPSMRS
jgi:nucleotide-binding universal stress UspA family protein